MRPGGPRIKYRIMELFDLIRSVLGLTGILTACLLHTEKVGFGLWWRRLLDFLSRSDGGGCPDKKNRGSRNAISI